MKIAALVARILLGLMFFAAGGFGLFMAGKGMLPPATPGVLGQFTMIYFQSHWVVAIAFMQGLAGLLLLCNRYVPLALIILAGILFNILTIHITMDPKGLPAGLIATGLWILTALPHRPTLMPLLNAQPFTDEAKIA